MYIYLDESQLKKIEEALDYTEKQARPVMKEALNKTAKTAQKSLVDRARQVYLWKKGVAKKDLRIKNARINDLVATLHASGQALELYHFSARGPVAWTQTIPGAPPTKAHGIRSNPMKYLKKDGIKAFIARMPSGHKTIVSRTADWASHDTSLDERYLKTILTVSVPQMLGNEEKVWEYVLPTIRSTLESSVLDGIVKRGGRI